VAPLYLPYISPISPLYLPYISPISPLYLPYISPTSPLYLPRWARNLCGDPGVAWAQRTSGAAACRVHIWADGSSALVLPREERSLGI